MISRRNILMWAATAGLVFAQKPSPAGTAEVELGGKKIVIAYSRPSMRGRQIMGALVPYGQVWRTGANEATALKSQGNMMIGETALPAGNYTLYSLPGANQWQLIINKQTGQWGTEYDQSQDFARVALTKTELAAPVEQFTIEFVKKSGNSADLVLKWEKTQLSVPVRVAQ